MILQEAVVRSLKNIVCIYFPLNLISKMRGLLRQETNIESPSTANQFVVDFLHIVLYRNGDVPFYVTAESLGQHDRSEFVNLLNSTVKASSHVWQFPRAHFLGLALFMQMHILPRSMAPSISK